MRPGNASGLHPWPVAVALELGPVGRLFEEAGYVALTPDWPDDPETIEGARAEPEVLANKTLKQVADHTTEIINALDKKPVVMGHSTGGLLAEMLAGQGLSAVTVAIDPESSAAFCHCRGDAQGSRADPAQPAQPRPRDHAHVRPVQIRLGERAGRGGGEEALRRVPRRRLRDPLAQMGNANLNPWTESKVDTKNPDRGPLLIIEGEKDHTVPWAIANAAYQGQKRNPGATEIVKMANRGDAFTIDHGWREVAETALAFVKRFA